MRNSVIEEIKERLDIVEVVRNYVKLTKAGANYRGLCPFHSEKTPSFFVSPSRQIWHCFGACSEGGDIFKFIMKIEGVEFGDALRILAKKAGVELKRESPALKTERSRLYDISELACRFFEIQLNESAAGRKAKEYLLKRGVKEESIKKWRLGYAPDTWQGLLHFLIGRGYKREEIEKAGLSLRSPKTGNCYDRFRGRIIFPVFNLNSQVIGFGGRIFNRDDKEEAKYINTPSTILYNKSQVLYGLDKASKEIRKKDACLLVEGYMDVIMTSQIGLENVVATSGTALTPSHLRILKRYSNNLLTAFDMDVAGDSATKRGINMAQNFGFNIRVVEMPQETDPAEIALEDPEKLKDLVKKAKSIHDFYFENVLSKIDKESLEGKKEISKILLPVIKRIPNKIEQSVWIKDLAEILEVKEEAVVEELSKVALESSDELTEEKEIEKESRQKKHQKTRKELLEEYLVVLAIKSPENINLLKEEDFNLFSLQISRLIRYIKNNKKVEKTGVVDSLSKTDSADSLTDKKEKQEENDFNKINDFLNYFSLRAEIEEIEDSKIKEEFESCLREIRELARRERLSMISREIKKAERERDFKKVDELIKEFNQSSKLRVEAEDN